jgi:hypothetical protein
LDIRGSPPGLPQFRDAAEQEVREVIATVRDSLFGFGLVGTNQFVNFAGRQLDGDRRPDE